jgi:hypothetical protein
MKAELQSHVKNGSAARPFFAHTPAAGLLQRKCACGGAPGVDGECAECRRKRLSQQGQTANFSASPLSASAPPVVPEGLRSFSRTLTPPPRAYLDTRFGHDFSRVGVQAAQKESPKTPRARFIGEVMDTPTLAPNADGSETISDGGEAATPAQAGGGGCTDICNRAYADASLNFGGGGVICDGATKCACVFDVAPLRRGQCPGFDAIVLTHERRHLTDVDCNPSGGLHRPPFRDPSQATTSECTHRRESIAEMNRIIPGASGICRTGMVSIRDQLNTWVTANCGASTP